MTKAVPEEPHELTLGEQKRLRIIKRAALEFTDGMYGILGDCVFISQQLFMLSLDLQPSDI